MKPAFTRMAFICFCQFVLFYFYQFSSLAGYVESRISLPGLFLARDYLEMNRTLSKELKVFSYDDTTADLLGKPDLTLLEWATMLESIDKRNPRAIYVDALFSLPLGESPSYQEAITKLKNIKSPMITAAFVTPKKLSKRAPLLYDHPKNDAMNMYGTSRNVLRHGLIPMESRTGWHAYGPSRILQDVFTSNGHAMNAGFGRAQAIIRTKRKTIVPHFAYMGPGNMIVRDHQFIVDGKIVPIDENGRTIVNFTSARSYYKHAKRLLGPYRQSQAGKDIDGVDAGDTVLILPNMFTGGTDFTVTPVGPLPGGFVISSLLNSQITGQHIEPFGWQTPIILLACTLGGLVIMMSGASMWVFVYVAAMGWIAGAIAIFSYGGRLPDVSTPLFAFCCTALSLVALRHHVREKMAFIMRILKTENEALRSEINQAGEISKVFIPDRTPRWSDLDVGAFHESLMAASGDWFAFETSESRRFRHFIMCDITGHGVQAAIIVSSCKTVLSLAIQNNPEALESADFLSAYAKLLNRTLFDQGHGRHVTTMAGITLDVEQNTIHYFCAGHPSPLYLDHDKESFDVVPLISQHNPLGFFREFEPELKTQTFKKGDQLLVFTDGAEFPRHPNAMKKIVAEAVSANLSISSKRLSYILRNKSSRGSLMDDVSIVWFRFAPPKLSNPRPSRSTPAKSIENSHKAS